MPYNIFPMVPSDEWDEICFSYSDKDLDQCRVADCYQEVESKRIYCSEHRQLCSVCRNRSSDVYCSEHKYSCQRDGCQQRLDSSYSYCSEHEQKYFCQECRVRIGIGESYCSQHQNWKHCPVRNKVYYWQDTQKNEKYAIIKDWASYMIMVILSFLVMMKKKTVITKPLMVKFTVANTKMNAWILLAQED